MKKYLFILLSIFSFVSEAFLVLSNEEMPLTCYANNQIVIYVNGNEFTFDKNFNNKASLGFAISYTSISELKCYKGVKYLSAIHKLYIDDDPSKKISKKIYQ